MKENTNTGYQIKIGKTTYIVGIKQSPTAKKSIEVVFSDLCKHDVLGDIMASNLFLDKFAKTS